MRTLFCGGRHTYMGTDNSVLYGKRPPPGASFRHHHTGKTSWLVMWEYTFRQDDRQCDVWVRLWWHEDMNPGVLGQRCMSYPWGHTQNWITLNWRELIKVWMPYQWEHTLIFWKRWTIWKFEDDLDETKKACRAGKQRQTWEIRGSVT